jgi:hypothetical protein
LKPVSQLCPHKLLLGRNNIICFPVKVGKIHCFLLLYHLTTVDDNTRFVRYTCYLPPLLQPLKNQ